MTACSDAPPQPGLLGGTQPDTAIRHHDVYPAKNLTGTDQCVRVGLTPTAACTAGHYLQSTGYLGASTPAT